VKDLLRAGPLLQMGWLVALSVLIPLGIGLLLDRRFGTAPLFVIVGALLGILTSTVTAVRITTRTIEALSRPLKDEPETDEPVTGADPGRKED
jgi:F0F1-type ATP synthase assembly protein I